MDGWQAIRALELIESCYAHKRRIAEPWAEFGVTSGISGQRGAGMNWRNETVFVTGATGFIGGRVCERMLQAGVPRVRALVHGMNRAARIARMPVELCPGDLLERESLRQALGGAKVVIHCGLGPAEHHRPRRPKTCWRWRMPPG